MVSCMVHNLNSAHFRGHICNQLHINKFKNKVTDQGVSSSLSGASSFSGALFVKNRIVQLSIDMCKVVLSANAITGA